MYCVICNSDNLTNFFENNSFKAVASDCTLVDTGFKVFVCKDCNHFQKEITENYLESVKSIYMNYNSYKLSGGLEQLKFLGDNSDTRSTLVIKNISKIIKTKGKLLDIGTGKGVFLRSFSNSFKSWDLYGQDISSNCENEILQIENVKGFYSKNLHEINEQFDLISLIHVLEHFQNPNEELESIQKLLKKDGIVIFQIPYLFQNFYDLIIFDHISHFNRNSVINLLKRHFKYVFFSELQIEKEITVLASNKFVEDSSLVIESIDKLNRIPDFFSGILDTIKKADEKFSVFGTSIAGTFLAGVLNEKLINFLDEDPSRIGKTYMNRRVLHPTDFTGLERVLLPSSRKVSRIIKEKFKNINFFEVSEI